MDDLDRKIEKLTAQISMIHCHRLNLINKLLADCETTSPSGESLNWISDLSALTIQAGRLSHDLKKLFDKKAEQNGF